jgi:hypothetical protein
MKKLLIILGAIILIAVVVVVFTFSSVSSSAIKGAVEKYGPRFTKTSVTLEGASLSPVKGSGGITGLVIGNPEGYTTERAISMGQVDLDIDPASLLKDAIVIEKIYIDAPEFTYERKLTTSNLETILANIKAAVGTEETPKEDGKEIRFIINEVLVENAKVNLVGFGKQVAVTVPKIGVTEIGTAQGGVTPDQAAYEVMQVILGQVIAAGVDMVQKEGLKVLSNPDGVEQGIKDAGESLRGLLNRQ